LARQYDPGRIPAGAIGGSCFGAKKAEGVNAFDCLNEVSREVAERVARARAAGRMRMEQNSSKLMTRVRFPSPAL
jgi:hypothetical protein